MNESQPEGRTPPGAGRAAAALVESALNRYLALDPGSAQRARDLEGHCVAVAVTGLGVTLCFAPGADRIRVDAEAPAHPDVVIRGTPFALAAAVTAGRADAGDVVIEGDAEVAQRFQKLLRDADIDWEEVAAGVTGDVVAHQAGRLARGLRAWGSETLERLVRDLDDYLHEESALLPPRDEVETLHRAIEGLRTDTDRLTARVERLERRLRARSPDDTG